MTKKLEDLMRIAKYFDPYPTVPNEKGSCVAVLPFPAARRQ